MKQIFSKDLLEDYYSNFKSSNVPNFNTKKSIIEDWINELQSGKLDTLKEEEVKSRFINNLFGDVLDFNYGNSNYWLLREEAKTKSDGTKPDAALGYFTQDKRKDDVRVVIEIKDAATDLDKKQKREGNKSPVDQAFEYAPKMGGNCKWVIVSNFKEIRFYSSTDRNKYQSFLLENFSDNETLKEFLFLFHKDKFISKQKKSLTDSLYEVSKKLIVKKSAKAKTKHILDDLYNCLFRFKGLGFVDPNYICSLYPFNILDEYVWHYNHGTLFTINKDIYDFLQQIEIGEEKIHINECLIKEFTKLKVVSYEEKLKWIITFLNKSHIYNITAIKDYIGVQKSRKNKLGFSYTHEFHFEEDEGFKKQIYLKDSENCDCLSCNYRSLDFTSILKKIKTRTGDAEHNNSEYAYGNYLVSSNNFKNSYKIYKYLEKDYTKEGKGIAYFLSKLNTKYLENLIKGYYYADDQKEILEDIRIIDLDSIIHSDLDYEIDNDVRRYLVQIKEEKLFHKVKEEVKKINSDIDKLKKLYNDDNGHQTGGGNLPSMLAEQYHMLYLHINRNYIIQDTFTEYKNVFKEIFSGLIASYQTIEVGLQEFNEFYISEAIIHINSDDLENLLKPISLLKINEECFTRILIRFRDYFASFFKNSLFAFDPLENELMTEYLLNRNFKNRLRNIFNNIFILLCKCEINESQFAELEKNIIPFLTIEKFLYWNDLDNFCAFLIQKGCFFQSNNLIKIFEVAVKRDISGNNKYERLIKNTCLAIHKFYPDVFISNQALIKKAINNCYSLTSDWTDFRNYLYLYKIADDNCKSLLTDAIDEDLDKSFKEYLYGELLRNDIYDYQYKDYFQIYVSRINEMKGYGVIFKNNKMDTAKSDFVFFNFALLMHAKEITLSETNLSQLENLSDFEKWLLNPFDYNYAQFQMYWMYVVPHKSFFMKKISKLVILKELLEQSLKSNFDQELSNMYVKYFI